MSADTRLTIEEDRERGTFHHQARRDSDGRLLDNDSMAAVNAPPPTDQGDVGVLVDSMDTSHGGQHDSVMHDTSDAPLNAVVEALSGMPQSGPMQIVTASHVTSLMSGLAPLCELPSIPQQRHSLVDGELEQTQSASEG